MYEIRRGTAFEDWSDHHALVDEGKSNCVRGGWRRRSRHSRRERENVECVPVREKCRVEVREE